MLSIRGRSQRLCSGISRRDAITIGALGLGGLTLPDLLRAESQQGVGNSKKAVIMIYMCGAPPHQDMYDLKMDAPSEIRGEFQPIETKVPGIRICEHLPHLAKIMDKCVPLRTVVGSPSGDHDSFICYTGRPVTNQPPGGWPSMGSAVSKLLGSKTAAIPAFVGLSPKAGHPPYGSPGHPGFAGSAYTAFRPNGDGKGDLVLNGISADQLQNRRSLLNSFDQLRREVDTGSKLAGQDAFTQQAFGVLTSSTLADALDVSKEPQSVRDRYGKGFTQNYGDGAPRNGEHFLIARRLVEAGARVVTLNFGRWDFHEQNFSEFKNTHAPIFDQALSALIEDLYDRGLGNDVSVVAWGEFGRTPVINKQAGRDHWPQVGGGLLAGGGLRTGQVIGETDRLGGAPANRPVHFGEVLATLYAKMGIDPNKTTLRDLAGRPQYLVDGNHQPMPELM
jgi:hypothetical protein